MGEDVIASLDFWNNNTQQPQHSNSAPEVAQIQNGR
jgi:hypothetical protein